MRLPLLRLCTELSLTLLSLLTLLGSGAVLGLTGLLTEGGLLALLRLGTKLGLTLRLSVCLRRVAEGRLRDLLLRRQGGSGLAVRGSLRLRCALEDCLLEVLIVCLGGLAHGSLGLDVGDLGLDVGDLGFCGSLNVRLFDCGLLDGGLSRGGVSLGLRFLVDTGERLDLLAGFLRGGLGLGDRRLLGSRGLRGNNTLVRQPLPEGRVRRSGRAAVMSARSWAESAGLLKSAAVSCDGSIVLICIPLAPVGAVPDGEQPILSRRWLYTSRRSHHETWA